MFGLISRRNISVKIGLFFQESNYFQITEFPGRNLLLPTFLAGSEWDFPVANLLLATVNFESWSWSQKKKKDKNRRRRRKQFPEYHHIMSVSEIKQVYVEGLWQRRGSGEGDLLDKNNKGKFNWESIPSEKQQVNNLLFSWWNLHVLSAVVTVMCWCF